MKHKWELNKDGTINEDAWDMDYHNGVRCQICGKLVCINCEPNYLDLDDCPGYNNK